MRSLYRSSALTVLRFVWPPAVELFPHDHRMWAAIGIYGGGEDNTFFRRVPEGLVVSGGKQLRAGDVALLGADVIHAVANPSRAYTAAIHVYGGDYFGTAPEPVGPDHASGGAVRRRRGAASARRCRPWRAPQHEALKGCRPPPRARLRFGASALGTRPLPRAGPGDRRRRAWAEGPVRGSWSRPVTGAVEVGSMLRGLGESAVSEPARPSGSVYGLSAASTTKAVAQSSSSLPGGPTS